MISLAEQMEKLRSVCTLNETAKMSVANNPYMKTVANNPYMKISTDILSLLADTEFHEYDKMTLVSAIQEMLDYNNISTPQQKMELWAILKKQLEEIDWCTRFEFSSVAKALGIPVKGKYTKTFESWDTKMKTPASKKGMFKGKTKAELRSELSKKKAQSKKLHDAGKPEPQALKTKIKELEFALRAKNKFGKVDEGVSSAPRRVDAGGNKYYATTGGKIRKFSTNETDAYVTGWNAALDAVLEQWVNGKGSINDFAHEIISLKK